MDKKAFRAAFPEFNDTALYPDSALDFWAIAAEYQVGCRWGSLQGLGVQLYVAHEITIEAQRMKAGAAGGNPGAVGGLIQSKQVGSVNVAYDRQSTTDKNADYWNLTVYGQRYWRYVKIFGAGVIQT